MADLHQETSAGPGYTGLPLSPEAFMRRWQQAGVRALRAQERLMSGMMKVTRLEIEYGQEFFSSHMGMLKWDDANPQQGADRTAQDMQRLFTVTRAVSEELRRGFAEATRLLTDGMLPQFDEAREQATEALEQTAHKIESKAEETAMTGAAAMKEAATRSETAARRARETPLNNNAEPSGNNEESPQA
jgi:hypothetical protein